MEPEKEQSLQEQQNEIINDMIKDRYPKLVMKVSQGGQKNLIFMLNSVDEFMEECSRNFASCKIILLTLNYMMSLFSDGCAALYKR